MEVGCEMNLCIFNRECMCTYTRGLEIDERGLCDTYCPILLDDAFLEAERERQYQKHLKDIAAN